MDPVIELWIEQKYLNVPVALNVKLKADPAATWPSNVPSFVGGVPLDTVWVVPSLFDHVTVVPFVTSSAVVANANPEMSIAAFAPPPPAAGADVPGAALHAAVNPMLT